MRSHILIRAHTMLTVWTLERLSSCVIVTLRVGRREKAGRGVDYRNTFYHGWGRVLVGGTKELTWPANGPLLTYFDVEIPWLLPSAVRFRLNFLNHTQPSCFLFGRAWGHCCGDTACCLQWRVLERIINGDRSGFTPPSPTAPPPPPPPPPRRHL